MRPNYTNSSLTVSGAIDSAMFGISSKDEAHIMSILRDTLYTDRVLAVLREYGSNAWDAHRSVGKGDLPIYVSLPKLDSPNLIIRDFGPGLSREGIFKVYTQYGASSKREDDNAVGMMGIGSKSAFAYSDTFTITSYHACTKSVYSASLDPSNRGKVTLLHEEPCDADVTGIEINIPVKSADFWAFEKNASDLFRHFNPRPNINITLPEQMEGHEIEGIGRLIITQYKGVGWTAVMGCIPYKVSLHNVIPDGGPNYLSHCGGTLYFDIGEVQISASREELKYSDATCKAVREKIFSLVDKYVEKTLKDIEQQKLTPWETKIRRQELSEVGLLKDFSNQHMVIPEGTPFRFYAHRTKEALKTIRIHKSTKILIKDDDRLISGFGLSSGELMVRPLKGKRAVDPAKVREFVKAMGIEGIPIELTSARSWVYNGRRGLPPSGSGVRTTMKSHAERVFSYIPGKYDSKCPSGCWEYVAGKVPAKEDVYVILEHFEADFKFPDEHDSLTKLLVGLGENMPTIYGYRQLKKSPIIKEELTGKEFRDWRKELITNLCQKYSKEVFWSRCHQEFHDEIRWFGNDEEVSRPALDERFGEGHLLHKYYITCKHGYDSWEKVGYKKMQFFDCLRHLAVFLGISIVRDGDVIQKVADTYPVMKYGNNMMKYLVCTSKKAMSNDIPGWEKELSAYIKYVKDTDSADAAREK